MANQDQILQIVGVVGPLIINFVKSRRAAGQDIPAEGTPEYAAYMKDLDVHIASKADVVVAEIEDMKRRHPAE